MASGTPYTPQGILKNCKDAYPNGVASVSTKDIPIAGILTTIYGLEEVPKTCLSISCLWLHHGRLDTKAYMAPIAAACINDWNQRSGPVQRIGLIAVAYDQRNHGTREVHPLANKSWNDGNNRHAQDMYSIFHGTVVDNSLLIDHLGSYVFNGPDAPRIHQHIVMGISLGGHATWQMLFSDPRVSAAVVIIGCPDYMHLMSDRARRSKLESYTTTNGADFLGSEDFPLALISSCHTWDPKGILFGTDEIQQHPSPVKQKQLRRILDEKIKGKRVLVCSGADDKLVPYRCSKPFMDFLKSATSGWYADGNVYVEDNVYDGVGHKYSEGMARDATRFVGDVVAGTISKPIAKI